MTLIVLTLRAGTISIKSFPAKAGPTEGDACGQWDRLQPGSS
jgi:hypothetical protein